MTAQESFILRLRRQRERNEISLEQLTSSTRVSRELLEAFERNDLSEWPSGLYARAIVRGYATVVGLDASVTVNEFCRLFPQGDRRTASTVQEMAAIVAHISEYTDEFDAGADRRRGGSAMRRPPRARWPATLGRAIHSAWARLVVFKPRATSS
jgi:transcriptional regulator with XRE-family HTH domain